MLVSGELPRNQRQPEDERKLWCAGSVQTYLEREVRQIVNIGDLNTVKRFLRLCAPRTGQVLNISELAKNVGVSVPGVEHWLGICPLKASLWPTYQRALQSKVALRFNTIGA